MVRKTVKLFSYNRPQDAKRALRALRSAHPTTTFALVPGGWANPWGYEIEATTPDGAKGRVARAPLSSFGRSVSA